MAQAFPKVVVIEERPASREYIVEIAGVRCQATTTITGSDSPTPYLSFTVSALDAVEGSSPILRVEGPLTGQPMWNLCSWQDFLAQSIGAGVPAADPFISALPAQPPEAPPAQPAAEDTDTGSEGEDHSAPGEQADASQGPLLEESSTLEAAGGSQPDAQRTPEAQPDVMATLQPYIDQLGPEAVEKALADAAQNAAPNGESDDQQPQDGEPGGERSFL